MIMTQTEERIGKWMSALVQDLAPDDGPLMFCLLHAAVDQNQRTVRTWHMPVDADALGTLIGEVNAQAEDDANELGGMQRYFLKATLKGKDIGSITMRFNADQSKALIPAVDSEPASSAGLVAQSQRHTEATMRLLVQAFGTVIDSHQKVITAQQSMIDVFQQRQVEMLNTQFELASRKIEQDLLLKEQEHKQGLEAFKTESRARRMDKAWADMGQYAGHILHWASKGKIPILPTPQEQAETRLKDMLSTMDEATFQRFLAEQVPEAEHIAVTAAYKKIQREQAEARQAATAPQAPAELARKKIEDAVLTIAKGVYGRLGHVDVAALVPIVLRGEEWSALSAKQQTEISAIASEALGECQDLPAVSPDQAGAHLWSAIAANASSLTALGPALLSGTSWGGLAPDQRIAVARVANHVFKLLPWPQAPQHSEPTASNDNGVQSAKEKVAS
jgi:hypothetical protein